MPLVVTFRGSDIEGIVGPDGRYTLAGWIMRQASRYVARVGTAGPLLFVMRCLRPGERFGMNPPAGR